MKKILFLAAALVLLASCECGSSKVDPVVGGRYLYSYHWDKPDPFEDKGIDTVTVLGIQDGYIQYRKGNLVKSEKLIWFRDDIREIPVLEDESEEPVKEEIDDDYGDSVVSFFYSIASR